MEANLCHPSRKDYSHGSDQLLKVVGISESASMSPEISPPALLTLPLELREIIWFLVLRLHSPYWPAPYEPSPFIASVNGPKTDSEYGHYWGTEEMTRLLRTDRQIYQEASKVLYEQFTFGFGYRGYIRPFLNQIPHPSRLAIRTISLFYIFSLGHSPTDLTFEERRRRNTAAHVETVKYFTHMAASLPGLRRVSITIDFVGPVVDAAEQERLVESAVALARPFGHVETCGIQAPEDGFRAGTQREEIYLEAKKRVEDMER